MTRNLELPEDVLQALKKAAKEAGQTPGDWIVARLPANQSREAKEAVEGEPESLADLFSGRIGKIRSGGQEPLSEDCGRRLADHLEDKRRAQRL